MQQFKIRLGGFKEIRKQILIRTTPIMILAVAGGLFIALGRSEGENAVNTLPFVIPMAAAAVLYGLYMGIKRQKALFESYTLTITDEAISREQLNTPAITIPMAHVQEILLQKSGIISIKGNGLNNTIIVPAQVERPAELQTILRDIHPIIEREPTFAQKWGLLLALPTIGLMICVYMLDNKIIVGLSGLALTCLFTYSLFKTRNSKHIDNKTRKSMWWVLLPLLSVIVVTIIKLTGMFQQP